MPQDLEERGTTVQDILKKFETQALTENNCHRITAGIPSHLSGRNEWNKAGGSSAESKTVDVCSWTTRRRREQVRPATVRSPRPSAKVATPSSSPNLGLVVPQQQQIRVSEIAKLFQSDPDISVDTNSSGKLKSRNESVSSDNAGDRSQHVVKNECNIAEQGLSGKNQSTNLAVPPQKPARTFAHDVYLQSKLIQENLGTPKLLRAHSNMIPKTARPKLPPKPTRAKTVPPIKGGLKSPQGLLQKGTKINRPKTPPPRPPPPSYGSAKNIKNTYPNPYAVSSAVTINNLTPSTDFSQRRPIDGQKGRYGVLRRFRSEERVYDVPAKKRSEPSFKTDTLDKWKSSLALDRVSDVIYVDNEVYETNWTPASGNIYRSKPKSSLGQKSRQELHYMSSPIIAEGRQSETWASFPKDTFWRTKEQGWSGRESKSFHSGTTGDGLPDTDVVNWSFQTLYGTNPKRQKENWPSIRQDESGSSDGEISEKDIQKRIEYIQKTSRGTSLAHEFRDRVQSYRRQFDAVLVIGLKYIDGTSDYHPYVKISFPSKESLTYDGNLVAQFCFPDADKWKPSACRETFSFALTNEKGTRVFGYCRRVKPEEGHYSIPIVYCVLSPILDRAYYFQVLNEIEKRHGLAETKMKSFLQTLQGRSVPQPGRTAVVKFSLVSGEPQQIALSRSNEFLTDNSGVFRLLTHLRVSAILKVMGTLLMERRVIFCASTPEVLSESIFAFMALLHPFRWPHTLVPILPANMLDVVSSPTPYVVGILNSVRPQLEDLSIEEGIMIDLDKSEFLREVGDETTIIPKSIQRAISTALKLIRNKPGDSENQKSLLVSEAFIRMFVELIGHFEKHYSAFPDGQKIFHVESFCTEPLSNGVQMFLKWFIETQMFDSFIRERCGEKRTDPFEKCLQEMQLGGNELKSNRRIGVWEFGKKMRNFGERLIGLKTPVKG